MNAALDVFRITGETDSTQKSKNLVYKDQWVIGSLQTRFSRNRRVLTSLWANKDLT